MQLKEAIMSRLGIVEHLLRFVLEYKWWWLTPIILLLVALAGLVVFAQSSAITPFIYTLF